MNVYERIKNDLNGLLQKARIIEIKRFCDLICFTFKLPDGREIALHIQCFLRIFDSDNSLVICSNNTIYSSQRYKRKKYERFDWTKVGATLFDDSIIDYKDKLFNTVVLNAKFEDNDIKIKFENGMRMDVFIMATKYEDVNYIEDYRIFGEDKNEEHYCFPPVSKKI